METEAVSKGFYKSPFTGADYQKIQMLTIVIVLSVTTGKRIKISIDTLWT
jgi:hypothetical protein